MKFLETFRNLVQNLEILDILQIVLNKSHISIRGSSNLKTELKERLIKVMSTPEDI